MSIGIIKTDFTLKKTRYPEETMRDADYTDDLELLANTPAQAGLHFKEGTIPILRGKLLKLVDQFT